MRIFGSPGKYIQGCDVIKNAGRHLTGLGNRFLIIGDNLVLSLVGESLKKSISNYRKYSIIVQFGGECSYQEIERLKIEAQKHKVDVIVAAGGGKAADTAKALCIELNLPVAIIPTVASTDAPTSHLAVIYDEDHVKKDVLRMKSGPNVVLVDTAVIANAPVRSLVAGMGDALSTKFEAEACFRSGAQNLFGGQPCKAALALADLSYELIRRHGEEAKKSAEQNLVTPALENVVEANILLSGLGFESGGLAAIHALHGGFTLFEELNHVLHGEKVAFGTLVQLILEKRPDSELLDIINFYNSIGLPTCFKDMGLNVIDSEKLDQVIDLVCQPKSYIHNMPFRIDKEALRNAILRADEIGKYTVGNPPRIF